MVGHPAPVRSMRRLLVCLALAALTLIAFAASPPYQPVWAHYALQSLDTYSPDGTMLAGGRGDGVGLYNVSDGQLIRVMPGSGARNWEIVFSQDGQIVAGLSTDYCIRVWRVSDGAVLGQAYATGQKPSRFAMSGDAQLIATPGSDGIIKVWDVATMKVIRSLTGHVGQVADVVFAPGGHILASSGHDNTIRTWDADTGALRYTVSGTKPGNLRVLLNGTTLSGPSGDSAHPDGLWHIADGACLNSQYKLGQDVGSDFTADGSKYVTTVNGVALRLTATAKAIWTSNVETQTTGLTARILPGEEHVLLYSSYSRPTRLLRMSDGVVEWEIPRYGDSAWSATFLPGGFLYATGYAGSTNRAYDVLTGAAAAIPSRPWTPTGAREAVYSPDWSYVTCYTDGLGIWATATGQRLANIPDAVAGNCAPFTSIDRTLVVSTPAGDYWSAGVWRTSDGQRVLTFDVRSAHDLYTSGSTVRWAALTPWNGSLIVLVDGGLLIELSLPSGARVRSMRFATELQGAAMSPDGTVFATVDYSGQVSLYRVSDWHLMAKWTAYAAYPAFSPDGRLLATAGSGGVALWPVPASGVSLTLSGPSPLKTGSAVTCTAGVLGLTNMEYQFWQRRADEEVWHLLRNWSTAASVTTWKPANGSYEVKVYSRVKGSTVDFEEQASAWCTIGPAISKVTLTTAPSSPGTPGTPVQVRAVPSGLVAGQAAEYAFEMRTVAPDGAAGAWQPLRAFGAGATCVWTPDRTGRYQFRARGREMGATRTVESAPFAFTVGTPVADVRLDPSPGLLVPAGVDVKLTAVPSGGITPEYRFLWMRVGGERYEELRAWAADPVVAAWRPGVGRYQLFAQVREIGSSRVLSSAVRYLTVTPDISAVQLTGSPASPTAVGQKVVLMAGITGGAAPAYRFEATPEGASAPTFARDYTTSRTTWWTPSAAGTYAVRVLALDAGTTVPQTATMTYVVRPAISALALTMTNPPGSPTALGVPIKLLATATNGGTLEYQFLWNFSETTALAPTWTKLPYGSGRGYNHVTDKPGYYTFRVYAREKGSTANFQKASSDLKVLVNPPITDYGITVTPSGSGQYTISVANVVGTGGAPLWKFWVRKVGNGSPYSPLQAYSPSAAFDDWTPTAGTYSLMVYMQEAGSSKTNYDISRSMYFTAP